MRTTTDSVTTRDIQARPLPADELRLIDAYWRAANYLTVGQIYLMDNPLLREPLRAEHIKPRLLGHWGTSPGLNLHLRPPEPGDRQARPQRHLHHRAGPRRPGDRGQHLAGGHLQRAVPAVSRDEAGMARLFRQFSFPGGIPSHVAPEVPGLDPRGRRAGLLADARVRRGASTTRTCVVACVIGDGEAETGAAGRAAGCRTCSSTRRATARCCRSCTSTATRSPTRRCWPASPRTT